MREKITLLTIGIGLSWACAIEKGNWFTTVGIKVHKPYLSIRLNSCLGHTYAPVYNLKLTKTIEVYYGYILSKFYWH
jgi:hypothetical protein